MLVTMKFNFILYGSIDSGVYEKKKYKIEVFILIIHVNYYELYKINKIFIIKMKL